MTAARGYDPVPDLAQLIDGLHDACTDQAEGSFFRRMGDLMAGPYGRLRGGLLLDEPGCEDQGTEAALREALQALITARGKLMGDADFEALAAEAERGYDLGQLSGGMLLDEPGCEHEEA